MWYVKYIPSTKLSLTEVQLVLLMQIGNIIYPQAVEK